MTGPYTWSPDRPRTLVVVCSDGRLQHSIDDHPSRDLGITDYDRLYLPGGPGALASSGELLRADVARNDLCFLLEAHGVERLVFLFHGAAAGGPEQAICADYRRRFFGRAREQIAAQQVRDARLLLARLSASRRLEMYALRADVLPDLTVQFTSLLEGSPA